MNCFHILKVCHTRQGISYQHEPELIQDSTKLEKKIAEWKEWFRRMNYAHEIHVWWVDLNKQSAWKIPNEILETMYPQLESCNEETHS